MTTSYEFKLILLLMCGVFWSITYIDIVRIGLKDKTYGMPFLALSLNFSWEVYNTVQGYWFAGLHIANMINFFWVLFDMGILYTYFRFGNQEFNKSKSVFYTFSILVLILSFAFQYFIGKQLGLVMGALYSAFWSNLLMSLLFIRMFYKRTDLKGQTLLIALSKSIGTLSITLLVGVVGINRLGRSMPDIALIGFSTFILDVWYIYLIVRKKASLNNNRITLWFVKK